MKKKEIKKRILWVDIAKALAILSIIFSHTLDIDMTIRTMLFSFHVPLFFILSGYTTKLATDKETFFRRLKKNFKRLMIPTFIALVIYSIAIAFIPGKENYTDVGGFLAIFKNIGDTFYDFFGKAYVDSPTNITAVWLFIALFEAKTIMDLVNIGVKSEKNWLVFFLLGFLGVYLGVSGRAIPAFLDMAFVATMFVEMGILYRKYERKLKKYTEVLLILALFYWFSQVMAGVHIEVYTRFFAGYERSVLTAVAGSYIACNFAMMMEEVMKKARGVLKKLFEALVLLGQNTLLVCVIHCLDVQVFGALWDFRDGSRKMMWVSAALRLAVNLGLFIVIYSGKKVLWRLKKS